MATNFKALTVVLEEDMRDEDAAALMAAIGQMRGVLSVGGEVADLSDHVAGQRVRHEISQQLMGVLFPNRAKS